MSSDGGIKLDVKLNFDVKRDLKQVERDIETSAENAAEKATEAITRKTREGWEKAADSLGYVEEATEKTAESTADVRDGWRKVSDVIDQTGKVIDETAGKAVTLDKATQTLVDNAKVPVNVPLSEEAQGLIDKFTVLKNDAAAVYDNANASSDQYTGKLAQINAQLMSQSLTVQNLSSQMIAMLSGDVTPKSVISMEQQLEQAKQDLIAVENEFSKLFDEYFNLKAKMEAGGGLSDAEKQRFNDLNALMDANAGKSVDLKQKINELSQALLNVRANPQAAEEFQALNAKLEYSSAKMVELQDKLQQPDSGTETPLKKGATNASLLAGVLKEMKPLLNSVLGSVKRLGNGLASGFKGALSHIKPFNKHLDLSHTFINKFMRRVKNMAINTFIFFQIRKAIRAMFASFADGFKEYAKFDTQFLASITKFKDAGVKMNNTLAAGFIPLIKALLPYLNELVRYLTLAADKMAQFIAALAGQRTYTKAKDINTVKEALDGVKESADEAKGSLAGFDQLNVQSMSKQDEAPKDYFETAAIDTSILDTVKDLNSLLDPLLEKLKQMKLDLGDAFKKVKLNFDLGDWENLLTPLTNLLAKWMREIDWTTIKKAANLLGRRIAQILNSVFRDKMFADAIGHTIAEMINTGLSFADGFLDEFKFKDFGEFVGTMVNAFIRDFDWKLCGEVIGEGVNGAVTAAIAFLDTVSFQRLGKSVGDMVQTAIDTTEFPKLGELGAKFINSISESILGFFEGYEEGSFASGIAEAINSFFENWNAEDASEAINTFLHAVFTEIQTLLDKTDWEMTGIRLGEFFAKLDIDQFMEDAGGTIEKLGKAIFEALLGAMIGASKNKTPAENISEFADNIFKLLFPSLRIKSFADGFVNSLYDDIKNAWGIEIGEEPLDFKIDYADTLALALTDFKTWSESIKNSFSTDLATMSLAFSLFKGDCIIILEFLKDAFDWAMTNILIFVTQGFVDAALKIANSFNDAKEDIIEKWEYIKTFFGIIGNDIEQKFIDTFNNIKDGIKAPINGILSLVESMINFIIDGLGGLSDLISKNLKIQMPDVALLGDLSGKTFGFDLPKLSQIKIPRLAQGAVIPPQMSEFIATLGDNNRETEFVSPKSAMKEAFMEAIMEMGLDGSSNVNVYLEGDAEGIFKVVRTENTKWKKQHAGAGAF